MVLNEETHSPFVSRKGWIVNFLVDLMCETKESSSVMIFGRGLLNKLVFGPHAEF